MKKSKKRLLSVLLSAALALQSIPFTSIPASAEGNETEYISEIYTVNSGSAEDAKIALAGKNYKVIDYDLNKGSGGDYIYMGYKTTTNVNEAITDFRMNSTNCAGYIDYSSFVWRSSCYSSSGCGDLDKGVEDSEFVYMYWTKSKTAGKPITALGFGEDAAWDGWESVLTFNGEYCDLNTLEGSDWIYAHVQRDQAANQQFYIEKFDFGYATNENDAQCKATKFFETLIPGNVNEGVNDNWLYLSKALTADKSKAVTGLKLVSNPDNGYVPPVRKIFDGVKYTRTNVNLNLNTAGSSVYLYYTTDSSLGEPIREVTISTAAVEYYSLTVTDGNGAIVNLNEGAGDLGLYLHYKKDDAPKKQVYVKEIKVIRDWGRDDAIKYFRDNSYLMYADDTNPHGDSMYVGYKLTYNPEEAVTDIRFDYAIDNESKLVFTEKGEAVFNDCLYTKVSDDYNGGQGGAYIYMYVTYNPLAGSPLTAISFQPSPSMPECPLVARVFNSDDPADIDYSTGEPNSLYCLFSVDSTIEAAARNEYISELAVLSEATEGDCKAALVNQGFSIYDYNLNEGTGKDFVYLGYKTTADPTQAITDIRIGDTGAILNYNGIEYLSACAKDMNGDDGIGGYLYYTTDPAAGSAIYVGFEVHSSEYYPNLETLAKFDGTPANLNATLDAVQLYLNYTYIGMTGKEAYINDIVFTNADSDEAAIETLRKNGYNASEANLFDGEGGEYVHLGYKYGRNIEEAITDLRVGYSDKTMTFGGLMGSAGVLLDRYVDTDFRQYTKIDHSLNHADNEVQVYLYITRDRYSTKPLSYIDTVPAGGTITGLDTTLSTTAFKMPLIDLSSKLEKVSAFDGTAGNLNKNVSEKEINIFIVRDETGEVLEDERYISELNAFADSDPQVALNDLFNGGCRIYAQNVNVGNSGEYVYIGYKTSSDPAAALTDIKISVGDSALQKTYDRFTYDLASAENLNAGAGGDNLYLFTTRDAKAGKRIESFELIANNNSYQDWTIVTDFNDNIANLNARNGGTITYMFSYRDPEQLEIGEPEDQYITDVTVVQGASEEDAYNQLVAMGYVPVECNVGEDGGTYNYIGYKAAPIGDVVPEAVLRGITVLHVDESQLKTKETSATSEKVDVEPGETTAEPAATTPPTEESIDELLPIAPEGSDVTEPTVDMAGPTDGITPETVSETVSEADANIPETVPEADVTVPENSDTVLDTTQPVPEDTDATTQDSGNAPETVPESSDTVPEAPQPAPELTDTAPVTSESVPEVSNTPDNFIGSTPEAPESGEVIPLINTVVTESAPESVDTSAPAAETLPENADTAAPVVETVPESTDTTAPVGETVPESTDTTAPVGETVPEGADTTAPVEETVPESTDTVIDNGEIHTDNTEADDLLIAPLETSSDDGTGNPEEPKEEEKKTGPAEELDSFGITYYLASGIPLYSTEFDTAYLYVSYSPSAGAPIKDIKVGTKIIRGYEEVRNANFTELRFGGTNIMSVKRVGASMISSVFGSVAGVSIVIAVLMVGSGVTIILVKKRRNKTVTTK